MEDTSPAEPGPPAPGRPDALALATVAARARAVLEGPAALPRGTPVVAACSGGADSVALVYALALLRDTWPLAGVAFVDHGLRDVAAERAAAQAAARAAGVPFAARRLELGGRGGGHGGGAGNLQARARAARYEALAALARDLAEPRGGAQGSDPARAASPPPSPVVATGHTRTDQAETVLQRAVRGAGLRGIAGIAPRAGRVVRPLLTTGREETRALGLPFADDPTNAGASYLRNRLRQAALPVLRAENPRVEEALAALAEAARGELELVDALADLVARDADLRGAPREAVEALVRWRHRWERGGAPPPREATRALAARLVQGGAPGRFSLGGGAAGAARRGRLTLFEEDDPRQRLVVPGPGHYRLGPLAPDVDLSLTSTPAPPTHARPSRALLHQVGADAPSPSPPGDTTVLYAAVFDRGRVAWPLVVRRARGADAVALGGGRAVGVGVGGGGIVLADAQGRILWAPGAGVAGFAAPGPDAGAVLLAHLVRPADGPGPHPSDSLS